MDELCLGEFRDESRAAYVAIIDKLAARGCDAVALVCTEIPLLITAEDSPLPILDSTRLLARAAVDVALGGAADAELARRAGDSAGALMRPDRSGARLHLSRPARRRMTRRWSFQISTSWPIALLAAMRAASLSSSASMLLEPTRCPGAGNRDDRPDGSAVIDDLLMPLAA